MIGRRDSLVLQPPQLLAGVVALYWGAMIGMAWVGLIVAILLEMRNWVSLRWDISEKGYVKSFYVSLFVIAVALILIRLDDVDVTSFSKMIRWSPLFGLPVELAQRYGRSDRMYLNTFFYFSRQRMKQDRKEGRPVDPMVVNTSYPYIFGVLIASTCTDRVDWVASVGMVVIVFAILFAVAIRRGMRWTRILWLLPIMLFLIGGAQAVMRVGHKYVERIRSANGTISKGGYNARISYLGGLGKIKQSPEIMWRVWVENDGGNYPQPQYIETGVYNKFGGTSWLYDYSGGNGDRGFETMRDAFDSQPGLMASEKKVGERAYVFRDEDIPWIENYKSGAQKIRIRGMGDVQTTETIAPSVHGFSVVSKIASSDTSPVVSPLGVLKLIDRGVVLDYTLWRSPHSPNSPTKKGLKSLMRKPDQMDTQVTKRLKNNVNLLVNEIRLDQYAKTEDKVEAVRKFFNSKFTYQLHFNVEQSGGVSDNLEAFMLDNQNGRRGHCEYFATTAALMLRRVGVPVRYNVGFVLREKDGDAWIARGTHGHAWCSVWMNGRWQIVDLTPPDWFAVEQVDKKVSFWQGVADGFKKYRQDFQVWRSVAANAQLFDRILLGVGLLLFAWFGWRIWRKRMQSRSSGAATGKAGHGALSLDWCGSKSCRKAWRKFERKWVKRLGPRPVGKSVRHWILDSEQSADFEENLPEIEKIIHAYEKAIYGQEKESHASLELVLNRAQNA